MGSERDRGVRMGAQNPADHHLHLGCPLGPPYVLSLVRSPAVKKGRHRRFEEARKLKQAGPSAFDLGLGGAEREPRSQDDEYAAIAEKYGVVFDEDDDSEESDEA